MLREALHLGLPADKVLDSWDFLLVNCAMYINSDVPGLSQANQPNTKPLRHARLQPLCCPGTGWALYADHLSIGNGRHSTVSSPP